MMDDKFVDKDSADPEDYDLNAELRKSTPPGGDIGWWVWVAGWVFGVLSIAVALFAGSWIILLGGLCFSAIFFGLGSVISKLDQVLDEIRCK